MSSCAASLRTAVSPMLAVDQSICMRLRIVAATLSFLTNLCFDIGVAAHRAEQMPVAEVVEQR